MKLTEIINQILEETYNKQLDEWNSIMYEEMRRFQELSNPNFAYNYIQTTPNTWEFNDKYGNILGVEFNPSLKYVDSYYKMKDLEGNEINVFDYESNKHKIDPLSFQGGTDQHRSDTICKIIRDEIAPLHLIKKKSSIIKFHPLNEYRYKIFLKCAEICKEEYPELEIKEYGKEIILVNK